LAEQLAECLAIGRERLEVHRHRVIGGNDIANAEDREPLE
jgi:hypothetical protein